MTFDDSCVSSPLGKLQSIRSPPFIPQPPTASYALNEVKVVSIDPQPGCGKGPVVHSETLFAKIRELNHYRSGDLPSNDKDL